MAVPSLLVRCLGRSLLGRPFDSTLLEQIPLPRAGHPQASGAAAQVVHVGSQIASPVVSDGVAEVLPGLLAQQDLGLAEEASGIGAPWVAWEPLEDWPLVVLVSGRFVCCRSLDFDAPSATCGKRMAQEW